VISLLSIPKVDITPKPRIPGSGKNEKKRREKKFSVNGRMSTCREEAVRLKCSHSALKSFMTYHKLTLERAVNDYKYRKMPGENMKGKSDTSNFGRK